MSEPDYSPEMREHLDKHHGNSMRSIAEESLDRKRVLVELGVSLALMHLREQAEKKKHVNAFLDPTRDRMWMTMEEIDAMLSSDNIDSIMKTANLKDET